MKSQSVIRKVINGRVKIYDEYFAPEERYKKYNGELDGEKFIFFLYRNHEPHRFGNREFCDFACCLGLEEVRRCKECLRMGVCNNPRHWPGPHCVDGVFVWEWWRLIR